MPRPSKRGASSSGGFGASDDAVAKKQKTNSEEDAALSPAVSPIAEPEPTPSSNAEIDDNEEEEAMMSGDHKTILQVLNNIKENPTRVDVAGGAFGFLKLLVRSNDDEDLMKYIIDADGISVISSLILDNPEKEGLLVEGCALLILLFKQVKQNPTTQGIEAVLFVMETLSGNSVLQTNCCSILWSVANKGYSDFIGDAGGIELILTALMDHPSNQEELLTTKCLGALMSLTYHSVPNRERIANAGGIELVTDTLKRCANNAEVRCGISVLLNLACNSEERTKSIVEAGGHVAVVTFMKKHKQKAWIQRAGCWALANLVACKNIEGVLSKKIADAGAIPAVVKAMKRHPNNAEIQRGACKLFECLSKGGNDILAAMNDGGVCAALNTAIQTHPSNKNIKEWAKESWNRLVDSLSSD